MGMAEEIMDVWILAGQSNVQGAGLLQGCHEGHDSVFNFSSAGRWEQAREPLHRLWESFTPVHQNLMRAGMSPEDQAKDDAHYAALENSDRRAGAGLGLAFGEAM